MSEKDFAIGAVGVPQMGQITSKPRYLVKLTPEPNAKNKCVVQFISLDKPGFEEGFISAKGFYCNKSEDEIVSQLVDIVSNTPKEIIQDVLLPTHRVLCIRNLIFNAQKHTTLVK